MRSLLRGVSVGFSAAIFVLSAVSSIGCGGRGIETVPVRGVVEFPEGQAPTKGTVYYRPLEVAEELPHKPANGNFAGDGKFEVTSFKPGDGLVPGTYSVLVECYKQADDGSWLKTEFEEENLTVESGTRRVEVVYSPDQVAYVPHRGM